MLHLIIKIVFIRFFHCKVTLPPPLPFCTPWKEVTVPSTHFWSALPSLGYLYNLFGILLHGRFASSLPPLFILMLRLSEIWPASGWLLLTYTLRTSLSCGTTRFSRLVLYIHYSYPRINNFSKSLDIFCFFLGEWYLEAKTLALRVLIDTGVLLLSGHLCRQKWGRGE